MRKARGPRGFFIVFALFCGFLPLPLRAGTAVLLCELASSSFPVTVRLRLNWGDPERQRTIASAILSRLHSEGIAAKASDGTLLVVLQSPADVDQLSRHALDPWGSRSVEPSIVYNPRRWETMRPTELLADLEREYRTFMTAHGQIGLRERALPPVWAMAVLANPQFSREPWRVLAALEAKYLGLVTPLVFVDPELGFLEHIVNTGGLPSARVRQSIAHGMRSNQLRQTSTQRHAGILARAIGVEVTLFFRSEIISSTMSPESFEEVVRVLKQRVLNDPLFLEDPSGYLEAWRTLYHRVLIRNAPESRALAVLNNVEQEGRLLDFAARMQEARTAGFLPLLQGTDFISVRWSSSVSRLQ